MSAATPAFLFHAHRWLRRRAVKGKASRFSRSFKSLEFCSLLLSFWATWPFASRYRWLIPEGRDSRRGRNSIVREPPQTWTSNAEEDEPCREEGSEGSRSAERPKSISRREAAA